MQSPFHNADVSVERASRIITGLFVALFVCVDSTIAVGWQTGELQERVLIPGQVLAEYTASKLERWAETLEDSEPLSENFNVTVTGGSTTSVTTTVNGETKSSTTVKTYTKTPGATPTPTVEPSYSPPAWFVESSAKSQAEFDAKSAQSKAEFEAYAAKTKAEFDAAKAAAGL